MGQGRERRWRYEVGAVIENVEPIPPRQLTEHCFAVVAAPLSPENDLYQGVCE